jgi:hypothetical protein
VVLTELTLMYLQQLQSDIFTNRLLSFPKVELNFTFITHLPKAEVIKLRNYCYSHSRLVLGYVSVTNLK